MKRNASGDGVVVAGWFGNGNFGDELLLHATLTLLNDLGHTRDELAVICGGPQRVGLEHDVLSARLPVIRRRAAIGGRTATEALERAALLILGPGTIFQERSPALPWPGTLPMFLRLATLARLRGVRVVIFGAAVREDLTPIGTGILRTLGAIASAVGVRDPTSAESLGRSAQVVGDVAWTLGRAGWAEGGATSSPKAFAVSLRPLPPHLMGPIRRAVHEIAIALDALGWKGTYLPMSLGLGANNETDLSLLSHRTESLLEPHAGHLEPGSFGRRLDDFQGFISGLGLMVATRLHAAVAAVMAGVPTVAIGYERKVYETMASVGLGSFVVAPEGVTGRMILDRLEELTSSRGQRVIADARGRANEWGDQASAFLRSTIV